MEITTYRLDTGELGAVRSGPSLALLTDRLRPGQGYLVGAFDPTTQKVDIATGKVVAKPPAPVAEPIEEVTNDADAPLEQRVDALEQRVMGLSEIVSEIAPSAQ